MGGKKKTKWRKLPLEEFTNDCSKLKRRKSLEDNKLDAGKKEEKHSRIPTSENVDDNSFPCNPEYAENPDAMWYPAHYLIYNPVEVPMYTNFAVPADTNCYYYPPNEINPAQEYATLPYQEYIPPMKDTVYLLFPASALRPPQYSPFDWRNRRRRRRYNGYAEYAVIPEKTIDENKCSEKKCTFLNTEKNSMQQGQDKISTLCSEKKDLPANEKTSFQDLESKKDQFKSKNSRELKDNMVLPKDDKTMPPSKKSKKIDPCTVHGSSRKNSKSKDSPPRKDPEREVSFEINDKKIKIPKDSYLTFDIVVECKTTTTTTTVEGNPNETKEETKTEISKNIENISFRKENSRKNTPEKQNPHDSSSLEISSTSDEKITNLRNEDTEKQSGDVKNETKLAKHIESSNGKDDGDNNADANSLSSENDVDEPESKTSHVSSRLKNLPQPQNVSSDYSKSNSIRAIQPIELPLISAMNKDNKSMYKLSYADSSSDRSRSASRSLSPTSGLMNPSVYIPKSALSDEINVYDGGSDAESGPEDLEMNPKVYESPHSNKSKHLYENELSLAVELLRTKESLPYDDEFKKIVENSVEKDDESSPPLEEVKVMSLVHNPFEELWEDVPVIPLDANAAGFKGFEDVDMEVHPGFRRSAAQFIRHYFAPCCIIM